MPKQHISQADEKPTTKYEWHVYWVYQDPEFISAVSVLINLSEQTAGIENTEGAEFDRRLQLIYKIDDEYEEIAKTFKISKSEVSSYKTYVDTKNLTYLSKFINITDSEYGGIQIDVPPNITYEEFISVWKEIVKFRESDQRPTKRKRAPDDTRLVYAVFKARKKYTFPQIFKQYQEGNLELYADGPTNQFASSKHLETYYRKYAR